VSRGFFAIGVVNTKVEANVGTLLRSADLYDAAFVFTVGRRYRPHAASDTSKTPLHRPLFHFDDLDDLRRHLPWGTPLVGVEMDPRATPLGRYEHRERACYLLGAEDHGLTREAADACHDLVYIEGPKPRSLNVSVAGSLVMHHRWTTRPGAVDAVLG
jgi:tRNA G18 (ribose-2'-O)-methylase SpoU